MEKIRIGIYDLFLSIENAVDRKDKSLAERLKKVLNDKIDLEINKEDFDYIIKNYTIKS